MPTSNLRISFIGDDGQIERLSTLSRTSSSSVEIDEIPADRSGRSFAMRIASCQNLYFWCSEKSKLLGDELLDKLKDLLMKKPSLTELTGISESRLGCFATHLRSFLGESTVAKCQTSSVVLATLPSDILDAHLATTSSKPSRPRYYGSQGAKPNAVYQASLSPRSSSFKEGLPRNLSTLKSVSREKFRRRGESHLSFIDNLSVASPNNTDETSANQLKAKLPEFDGNLLSPSSSFLDSLGKSMNPPFLSPSASEGLPAGSSLISPYYCWCPPVASNLQYTVAPLQLPISSTESFSLPPLSSLLSTSMPSSLLVAPKAPLNLSEIPSLDFPPFLPEPLVRLPLSLPTSQQIATFTPLMCDPIIHIPCIDICSSGPGYFVSAGPAISTTVPSLHPTLVNPLNPASDSMMMENSARETLRLLLSTSSQNNSQLMSVLPSVLTNAAENRSILAAGSRGLYEGVSDVGAIANSIAAMGLVSLSERSVGSNVFNRCLSQGDMIDQLEKQGGSGGTCLDDEGSSFSNFGED